MTCKRFTPSILASLALSMAAIPGVVSAAVPPVPDKKTDEGVFRDSPDATGDGIKVIGSGNSGPRIGADGWGAGGSGMGLFGRGAGRRVYSPAVEGGTKSSERAVPAALTWLANHQQSDGSWSFYPPAEEKKAAFANPGTWQSNTGATALAVLPFLGAGQTQESSGPYRQNVSKGLQYLVAHQQKSGAMDGDLTWHALATLVLCEDLAMTGDKAIGKAAQSALDHVVARQDPKTGGWSARPGQPPQTSVTCWQIMALRSGKMAGLKVPPAVPEKADKFLDAVQAEVGAKNGETSPKDMTTATTAAGLLARMQLRGKASAAALDGKDMRLYESDPNKPTSASPSEAAGVKRGAESLVKTGPAKHDSLCNLTATTFMQECSGPEWDTWNRAMRRQLVESQLREGAEKGSWWNPEDVSAADGGRLYQTALNTLNLEVYYRFLPIWKTH
jgi:hypothetical protein